jgi:hypothetical protein
MLKTFVVCNTGYKLIRIDYLNITDKDVRFHILQALDLNNIIYYSNYDMYDWLRNGIVQNNILYRESPYIWNKYFNKTTVDLPVKNDPIPNQQKSVGLILNIIR